MNRASPPPPEPTTYSKTHVVDELLDLRATVVQLRTELDETKTNVSRGLRSIHRKLDILIKRGET